jgi:predicted Zn-dependent protease with MMP-like domain
MGREQVDQAALAAMVAKVLDELPATFREAMDNVDTAVEDWPDAETMRRAGVRDPVQLLGFYHGVPLSRRGQNYTLVLPDKISIYRMPILMRCRTREEVRALVGRVVRHEVAHHFGIDDARLREIGAH